MQSSRDAPSIPKTSPHDPQNIAYPMSEISFEFSLDRHKTSGTHFFLRFPRIPSKFNMIYWFVCRKLQAVGSWFWLIFLGGSTSHLDQQMSSGKWQEKLQKGKQNWRATSLKRGKSLPGGKLRKVLSEKFKARRWQN